MIVKCIKNKISDLLTNKKIFEELKGLYSDSEKELPLIIGALYNVYAIDIDDSEDSFYVCIDNYDNYPTPFYSSLFEIIDPRFSRFWDIYNEIEDWNIMREVRDEYIGRTISCDRWSDIFYENLLDEREIEVELFLRYKQLIDLEYLNPAIKESLIVLDGEFVQCPECSDVWIEISQNEMAMCPGCKKIYKTSRCPFPKP